MGLSTREELENRLPRHGDHIVQAIDELRAEVAASRYRVSK